MRLSSLELQGFKSFPDKTRLEFVDGISAVVGPNGSGKSNIADAVRWVLGEQSTKTLRGSRMEDIIFSGTQARKAVGYAAVELTIDNPHGLTGSEDESITIGRRLYRSGESEYRINGNSVRLKDVHELFMDTGLGRDGYSIIGQGRIAEIVSAKSYQRRQIFEEAAGIAKYRYRRNEAQRQLGGADENLLRLNDILAELEGRVKPLGIQAEKAKKYLNFAQERKGLEISLWSLDLEQLKNDITLQDNNILVSKNDYNILENKGEALESSLGNTFDKMQQMVVSADQCRHEIKKLEAEQSENQAQIAVYYNDIQHNNDSLKKLTKEQAGAKSGEESLNLNVEIKEKAQAELAQNVLYIKENIRETGKKLSQLRNKLEETDHSLRGFSGRTSSLEQAMTQLQLEQKASETKASESVYRLRLLKDTDSQHKALVLEQEENLKGCLQEVEILEKKIISLNNSHKGYQLKEKSTVERHKALQLKTDELSNKTHGISSRIQLLKDMEASMDGYGGSVKHILNQSQKGNLKGVLGPVSALISTKPEYITAVETALGGALQNIVVEDEGVAKRGITLLKENRAGRATFLPLTSVKGKGMDFSHLSNHHGFVGAASDLVGFQPQFTGIILQLLGRICVVEDLDTGTIIAKQGGYRFRIVTLDGQVINAGGSYSGGATYRSAGVLGRRHEIKELKKELEALTLTQKDNQPDLDHIEQEQRGMNALLTASLGEIRTGEEELVRLGFTKVQMEKGLESATHSWTLAKEELEKINLRLRDLEAGKASSSQLLKENKDQLEALTLEVGALEIQRTEIGEETQSTNQRLAQLQMEELTAQNQLDNALGELERLKLQQENADLQGQNIVAQQGALEEKNAAITKAITTLQEGQDELKSTIKTNNESITQFMTERTQLEQSTTLLRKEERNLSAQREGLTRELVRLEERLQVKQKEYDDIIAEMWDRYELTRSVALEQAVALENPQGSKIRLKSLKKQIRDLGSVNLEAVEEYAEVSQRYEFLSAQLKDVSLSKEKLNQLIGELTKEMEELFINNFEKINKEFTITFRELFGGGHGELRLEDPEDLLESGIEIHVQPPGKVIKSLSLLSGGEQAFVAIAIYFAILKVTPAPFVLLDEIEAALDDVNVVKFAQYLRRLSKDTQFIAITHRRGTMEEADVLYGVTMQEDGVSKLLELNIQEVESKLGMGAE